MTISKVVKYDTNDAKKDLLSLVGDLSKFEVFNNQVLVAVYVRPEKTKGGIFLPDKAKDEDKYQSKVGLILKVGPSAFVDDAQNWFKGVTVQEHDWIIFRPLTAGKCLLMAFLVACLMTLLFVAASLILI